jgi:FdhE protein
VGCGCEEPAALVALQTASHPAVRIEACDRCRRYVKSIDLTLDARPLPEVDDLVSIAVDLRAQEDGYRRLEIGWAGV